MKEFKIDIILILKNITFYILLFIIANVLFPRMETSFTNKLFLFCFLFLLITYDLANRFRMILFKVLVLNNEEYEITIVINFRLKRIVLKKSESHFLFEDKLYGRGQKITFFSIWNHSNKLVEIKIPSDGWSKKKLNELNRVIFGNDLAVRNVPSSP